MTMTLEDLLPLKETASFPVIVYLCGSTRFLAAFQAANLRETLSCSVL
jgi:hypothetical protein